LHDAETGHVIRNKFAIVDDHRKRAGGICGYVDVIDVSGAVLATPDWAEYVAASDQARLGRWRVLLLEPGSSGAAVRAQESTVWAGDQPRMEAEIRRRSTAIADLARRFSVDCEIRYYASVPVSRYMRIGDLVYQSYYPADRTGRDVPIIALHPGGILDARARKEFEVLWESARGSDQPASPTTPSHIGTRTTGSALNT
jgi:hypothetical protein